MPALAVITGLSAGWLAAAGLAGALPILAHLLARRGGRLIDFPAVRFVMLAAASHSKRNRIRDAILLALRVLALVLIALAFDRPAWLGDAPSNAANGQECVIILDASASMTRTENGRTLFDAARARAAEALGGLDPTRDRAAAIIAAGAPKTVLPRLTSNIAALLAGLSTSEATLERGDMTAALNLARSLPGAPGEAAAPRRRVLVFTDLQRTDWAHAAAPAGCAVTIHPVGGVGPTPPNLALADPSITPARPIAGREALVRARVLNFGPAPRTIAVTLDAAGETHERSLDVAPNGEATATFPITFARPGEASITLSLADRPFTPDDHVYLVAEVRPARRIGILTAARNGDPLAATRFLRAALRPGDRSEFEPVSLRPVGLTRADLDPFDGVILCEAGAPDDATLGALAEYLDAGGGAAWIIDSPAAHDALARLGTDRGVALPVTPGEHGDFIELDAADAAALDHADTSSPLLRVFEGAPAEALARTTFRRLAPSPLAPRGRAVLTFASGEPFISWIPAGHGRLAVVQADLSPASSGLVKTPLFPMLAQELARFIEPAADLVRPAAVGAPILARVAGDREPAQPVTDSLGRTARLTRAPSGPGSPGEGAWLLLLPPAQGPGLIELRDHDGATIARAAANFDPAESDPRAADRDEIVARLPERGGEAGIGGPGISLAGRHAVELWPALLAAAMFALALESLFAAADGPRAPTLVPDRDPMMTGARA